ADLGISGTNFISVSASNLVTISGTAPLLAAAITVNGITFPVTWTTVTNWTVRVPIGVGTNLLTVQISDRFGQSLGSTNVTAVYAGAPPSDGVVFNEIMFNPAVVNAEYVELFNASSNFTYDLSGWKVNGLDYTFP